MSPERPGMAWVAKCHEAVLNWSRTALIAAVAAILIGLLLYVVFPPLPMAVQAVLLLAAAVGIVANLIYAVACAISWISRFRRRR